MKSPADMAKGPAKKGPQFQKMYDDWSNMPQPDPQTFIATIWNSGILSEMQKEMIAALLQNPTAAPGGPGAAAPTPGAPAAPAAPAGPGPAGPAAPMASGPAAPNTRVSPV